MHWTFMGGSIGHLWYVHCSILWQLLSFSANLVHLSFPLCAFFYMAFFLWDLLYKVCWLFFYISTYKLNEIRPFVTPFTNLRKHLKLEL